MQFEVAETFGLSTLDFDCGRVISVLPALISLAKVMVAKNRTSKREEVKLS